MHGCDFGGGGQVEELVVTGALLGVLEDGLQDTLRGVAGKGLILAPEVGGDGDARGDRGERDGGALRQRELGGDVVELFGLPRGESLLELGGAAGGARGPLEGGRGEQAGHAVIGVGGDEALGPEGDDHVRAQGAQGEDEISGDVEKVGAVEGAIGVVEHLAMGDAEMPAGVGKLPAADDLESFIVGGASAVGGALSGGETEDGALDAQVGIAGQDSTEGPGFVIGMGGDTEQP